MTDSRTYPASESALLPCPFCGSRNISEELNSAKWPVVECDDCGAHGPCIEMGRKASNAGWNARIPNHAQPPANPDAVKMYADALDAANRRIAELEAREWPVAQTAPDRMDKGRAFYLAMYEKDGAIWAANDHKGLWCDKADDYERRLSSLTSTMRQCPICARRVASPCETLAIATSCPLSSTQRDGAAE